METMWPVSFHDHAKAEFLALRKRVLREAVAIENAIRKLEANRTFASLPTPESRPGVDGLAGTAPARGPRSVARVVQAIR